MFLIELRIILLLVTGVVATYSDLKEGLIHNQLTVPMIIIGFILNLFEFNPFNLIIPAIVFLVFALLYYLGKIGGGDVKLFVAIAMLLPFYKNNIFILSSLFFAAVSSISFLSVYYLIKYIRKGIDFKKNKSSIIQASFLAIAIFAYFIFILNYGLLAPHLLIMIFTPLLFSLPFLALQKDIKERFFLKHVPLDALEEDEIIAKEFFENKQLFRLKGIITEDSKQQLKQAGITTVPVYRGLPPFAPFMLLGIILALLFPGILSTAFAV